MSVAPRRRRDIGSRDPRKEGAMVWTPPFRLSSGIVLCCMQICLMPTIGSTSLIKA